MKTGLKIYKKYRIFIAYINYFCFLIKKNCIGFDVAKQFIQRIDKYSLLLVLKKNGATIGHDCDIETGITFHNCKDYKNLIIGNNCHIGKNCFFDLRDKIVIGDNVVISMQCTFITHTDMNKSELKQKYPATNHKIVIHDNTYIGANTTVLMNVVLEKNCFIAACSLVNKNVEAYTMVGGVPAKTIKKLQ